MSQFIGNKGLVNAYVPRRNWKRTLLWLAGALIVLVLIAKIAVGQQLFSGELKSGIHKINFREIWLHLKSLITG